MRLVFTHMNREYPLFCESIGYQWQQEAITRPQGYPLYHWLQTTAGTGTVRIGGKTYALPVGAGILIRPGVPHSYRGGADWQTAYLTFGGALVANLVTPLGMGDYRLLPALSRETAGFITAHYRTLADSAVPDRQVAELLFSFLLLLRQDVEVGTRGLAEIGIVTPVLQYLDAHSGEKITNPQLAAKTGYTVQYLTSIFKRYYHQTPLQYLQELRLRKAKSLLMTHPEWNVYQVAEQVGFTDNSQFIQAFKAYTGQTPKKFQQERRR
ncbi:AraC family transcriptional regulator [Schleiferilactobacillus shenzhenensis]|uniref:AraC family transcriptional regulator n=1 Tax=Schleiferilactobacillus shenzhenensis TaxID=1231337 RepID=UPI00040FA014|nr:AraC family transcriptional regulator [Schleiferilactobacillus shenzhenensis]